MEPVHERNLSWTAIPKAFSESASDVLTERYAIENPGKFLCEGRIYVSEITLRLGYLPAGSIAQNNFEVSVQYELSEKAEDLYEAMLLAADTAHALFIEYFNKPRETLDCLPRQWQVLEGSGNRIHFQYSAVNSELEAAADRLLSGADTALVNEFEPTDALDFRLTLNDPEELDEVIQKFRTKRH